MIYREQGSTAREEISFIVWKPKVKYRVHSNQPDNPVNALSSHFFTIYVNLLAPELFFSILAHPVYKMWIIQEPNTLELWNKLHFQEKKTESIHHV